MVLECAALWLYRRATGQGLTLQEIVWNAAAGLGLLLALRNALTAGPWMWTALWLLAALCGHLGDLRLRWQTPAANAGPRNYSAAAAKGVTAVFNRDTKSACKTS